MTNLKLIIKVIFIINDLIYQSNAHTNTRSHAREEHSLFEMKTLHVHIFLEDAPGMAIKYHANTHWTNDKEDFLRKGDVGRPKERRKNLSRVRVYVLAYEEEHSIALQPQSIRHSFFS